MTWTTAGIKRYLDTEYYTDSEQHVAKNNNVNMVFS